MFHDFNILDYGAVANGSTDDAAAIQRTVDACAEAGGGRVVIPAGLTVLSGAFDLRSRVEFHVGDGARLVSPSNIEAFPQRVKDERRHWIGCRHAEDVTLSGTGTLDGQCHAFIVDSTGEGIVRTQPWRPALSCFENVRRLTVRDLTFRNAANWTLHFSGCQDIEVNNVKIFNDLKFPNADGIDPDHCRRVRISDCHIVSADDCIVLKNTSAFAQYGPCEDIEITRCRLESASAAFKIGSESVDSFRRVRMTDCVIERSNRGLGIQLRDQGNVEDVEFRNIEVQTQRVAPGWWGAGEAIYVTALPRNAETRGGTVRDVRFIDVRCRGENGIVVYGEPKGRISGIRFERVLVEIERKTPWPSGLFDVRPCPQGYSPPNSVPVGEDTPWGRPAMRVGAAISVDGADDIRFDDVEYSLPVGETPAWVGLMADGPYSGEPRRRESI
ncbi:MAG: glycosyl hydrolase family 28 protein [bacterium]